MQYKIWLEQQLKDYNAVITNSHLVLTSGKHSDSYINLRVLAGKTNVLYEIGGMISRAIKEREAEIKDSISDDRRNKIILVGPETLGRTLVEFTAIAGHFDFVWCDMKKDNDGNDFAGWNPKLNFPETVKRARCYIVDDLLTTAKSVKLTQRLIEKTGGKVEGVVVVARRSEKVTAEFIGVPWLYSLLDISCFNTWKADKEEPCPLCEADVPMKLRPGHGHEWINEHPGYPTC